MKVDYVNHMGDDLTVVNAARVSFHKESEYEFIPVIDNEEYDCKVNGIPYNLILTEADQKLIGYLAKNGHWTPFSHPMITVRVKAPIFVARQLFKHKVGMTENEVSRRYVSDEPEFFTPAVWRGKPTDGAKQGSSGEANKQEMNEEYYTLALERCVETYHILLQNGVAPELARMILPQSMYTEWYWTGSIASFARIYKLRSDSHAQVESQEIAKMLDDIIRPLFPVSWAALTDIEDSWK